MACELDSIKPKVNARALSQAQARILKGIFMVSEGQLNEKIIRFGAELTRMLKAGQPDAFYSRSLRCRRLWE